MRVAADSAAEKADGRIPFYKALISHAHGWTTLQVTNAATAAPTSDATTAGTALSLAAYTLAISTGPFAATQVTYSIDKGDGTDMGTCKTLGTTASGQLAATTLASAGSVTYSTAGSYTAVIRVYTAANCADGTIPTAAIAVSAAATVSIRVGTGSSIPPAP